MLDTETGIERRPTLDVRPEWLTFVQGSVECNCKLYSSDISIIEFSKALPFPRSLHQMTGIFPLTAGPARLCTKKTETRGNTGIEQKL